MAAHTILRASPSSLHLHPSFHGVPLKFPPQSLLTFSLSAPKRALAVVAATNKAVSVLKATSNVEGVLNLTQDADDEVTEATIVDSEIFLSDEESDDDFGPVSAVPKKRTSRMKKRIRKNAWKRKGAVAAKKAYSLAKSIYTGKSTSFMTDILKKDP